MKAGGSGESVEPRKGPVRDSKTDSPEFNSTSTSNMIIEAASSSVALGTAIIVEKLVNIDDVTNEALTPVHEWVQSRRRVAAAVEAQELAAKRTKKGRAEGGASSRFWPPALLGTYTTLVSAMEAPAKVVTSAKETTQEIVAAPGKIRNLTQEVVNVAEGLVETVSAVPAVVSGTATAVVEQGRRAERAFAQGVQAYESLREATRAIPEGSRRLISTAEEELAKTSKVVEDMPST